MTIGPAPMIMIDVMSLRLGIASHVIPGRRAVANRNPELVLCCQLDAGYSLRPSRNGQSGGTQKKGALTARPSPLAGQPRASGA
jgi:hypothetical protein